MLSNALTHPVFAASTCYDLSLLFAVLHSLQVPQPMSAHRQYCKRECTCQEVYTRDSQTTTFCLDDAGTDVQWKDKARAAEAEVQKLQSQLAHVEHASRAQELTLDQLKGRLSDKVTREERLARRDAEAYARLKRAFLSNKGMNPSLCGFSILQHAGVCICEVYRIQRMVSCPLALVKGWEGLGCYLKIWQAAWAF